MTTAIFDSHKYAKRLIASGMASATADIQAEIMVEVMTQLSGSTATVDKQDGKIDKLDAKIDKAVSDLTALIERTSRENTRWLMGVVISMGLLHASMIAALALKLIP